jgi:hypothetical protein
MRSILEIGGRLALEWLGKRGVIARQRRVAVIADDLVRVFLLQEVEDDGLDPVVERHLRNLLVLDPATQRERV